MLPDIRAVIAAMAAAIGLLIIAFGVVATLRVAQESRAGSLHADLAQRGHPVLPEPQPVVVIETPGPTLLAKAPDVERLPRAVEPTPASTEPPAIERELPAPPVVTILESPPIASVSPESDPDNTQLAAASPAAPESLPVAATEPVEQPAAATVVATAPQTIEALIEPPSTASRIAAIGGPSPEEIAQAKAQRKAADRARARKAAAEKRKKARAARIARERKAEAQRTAEAQAKQQASAASQPGTFGFAPTGSFNSAPFGHTFGATTNPR